MIRLASLRMSVWVEVAVWWFTLVNVLPIISVHAQSCITHFQQIYDQEALIADTNITRTYVLCPGQTFVVGKLDFNNEIGESIVVTEGKDAAVISINPPLPLRPNMKIRCGDDGSLSNMCWIVDGDLQLDGTAMRSITDRSVDNVHIEGVTFMGSSKHSLFVTKSGSITFENCEWTDFVQSIAPIMLDYFDEQAPTKELVVTFRDCTFRNNRYFGREAYGALIYANSNQNRLIVERSTFQNNDMVYNNTMNATDSFLIESLGPTCIDRTCFMNNRVGASTVAVFGSTLFSSQAYVTNSSGGLCDFASSFLFLQQYRDMNPLCVAAMGVTCDFDLANSTMAPPCSDFSS